MVAITVSRSFAEFREAHLLCMRTWSYFRISTYTKFKLKFQLNKHPKQLTLPFPFEQRQRGNSDPHRLGLTSEGC